MKRILYTLAAVATFASCSNDELVEVTPKQAITFGNAFVENATRAIDPSVTTNTLQSFKVFGTVQGEAKKVNIYNGVEVKRGDNSSIVTYADGWYYDTQYTQYWIDGSAYEFIAFANDNGNITTDTDGMPIEVPYDATQQTDLLYAKKEAFKYEKVKANSDVVDFTFNHLLSKVMFTFENTIETNVAEDKELGIKPIMYTYKVSDIKITNANLKGIYYLNQDVTWKCTDDKARGDVTFGNITGEETTNTAIQVGKAEGEDSATSYYARFLIPNKYNDLKVTCTIETLLNGEVIKKENFSKDNLQVELKEGNAYNFVISKGAPGEVIKFKVTEVKGWEPKEGPNDTPITEKQ